MFKYSCVVHRGCSRVERGIYVSTRNKKNTIRKKKHTHKERAVRYLAQWRCFQHTYCKLPASKAPIDPTQLVAAEMDADTRAKRAPLRHAKLQEHPQAQHVPATWRGVRHSLRRATSATSATATLRRRLLRRTSTVVKIVLESRVRASYIPSLLPPHPSLSKLAWEVARDHRISQVVYELKYALARDSPAGRR